MVEDWPDSLEGRAAGFVTRLVAISIDLILMVLVSAFIIWFGGLLDSVADAIGDNPINLAALAALSVPFVTGGYFVFLWWISGATLGNWIMGIRVVSTSGGSLTLWQALKRLFGYIVSTLALWIGFLWVLIDRDRRGWHDYIASTWVVYTWQARPGPWLRARADELEQPDAMAGGGDRTG